MPRFRAPQQSRGRLQASFGRTAKRSAEQKNGRKCDLATALLPKGDTRATNANTEYHGMGGNARGFWRCVVACQGRKVTPTASGRAGDRLVLEVQHDLQDLIGEATGVDTVHVGEHDDTGAPLRNEGKRGACPLLSSG